MPPVPMDWRGVVQAAVHTEEEKRADAVLANMGSSMEVFNKLGASRKKGWLDYAGKHPGALLRTKLRCGQAPLMLAVGHRNHLYAREDRTCRMCRTAAVESPEHFVSECAFYRGEREECCRRITEVVAGHNNPQLTQAIRNKEMALFLGDSLLLRLPQDIARQVDATVCNFLKVAWRKRKGVWKELCVGKDEWRLKDGI